MNITDPTALLGTGPRYSSETYIPAKVMDLLEQIPTLRDQFAVAALGPLIANGEQNNVAVEAAYAIADAMLEARKKGQAE